MADVVLEIEEALPSSAEPEIEWQGELQSTPGKHFMPFGAETQLDGCVRFRFWAPACESVQLVLEGRPEPLPMKASGLGWHELRTAEAKMGSLYRFLLPDGTQVADPASRFQPQDVRGPSEVVSPGSYMWHTSSWKGRSWAETVLYEVHLGAFSPEGTFCGAIQKLDHLRKLGVTAVEIMPVADFPGKHSWGYDGVLLYAPDSIYGRPEDFKEFIDAAHHRGISVILDVVYNHFGPDANYIPSYFPDLFTKNHKTDWGDAVNYDGQHSGEVREFVIHNALYWIEEYNVDGLRLDAVHAILDDGPRHILDELSERVTALALERPIHLILENDHNEAKRLTRDDRGMPVHYTAQWNDDLHHVLHTAVTQETAGYYINYEGDTNKLGRALAQGFCYQGETTSKGKSRGECCSFLPPTAFVSFIQNHDQIGNRAFGERMNHLVSPAALRAIAAVYLLLPQVPLLFMGEEWCASQPFPYFCDFEEEVGVKVTAGRKEEFSSLPEFADPQKRESIPDPQAESTFLSAKLDWTECSRPEQAIWLQWYEDVLRVRRERIVPLLPRIGGFSGSWTVLGPGAVEVRWRLEGGGELHLTANLSSAGCLVPPVTESRTLWLEGSQDATGRMAPLSVRWTISEST